MTKLLPLPSLRLDGGTQIRVTLDQEHIDQIAEAWRDGASIPPVIAFHDGTNYWLADGFHRWHSGEKNGFKDIEVDVRSGSRLDAVKFALSANATHGRPRTNADKRNAVAVALKEFPKMSDREIARICAVNHEMVGRLRPQLAETASSTRIGADGKERRLPVKQEKAEAATSTIEVNQDGSITRNWTATDENGERQEATITTPVPRSEQVDTRPERTKVGPISNGLMYADIAIMQLEKIEHHDTERAAAFQRVQDYITKTLRL